MLLLAHEDNFAHKSKSLSGARWGVGRWQIIYLGQFGAKCHCASSSRVTIQSTLPHCALAMLSCLHRARSFGGQGCFSLLNNIIIATSPSCYSPRKLRGR